MVEVSLGGEERKQNRNYLQNIYRKDQTVVGAGLQMTNHS